jgi:Arc/MetJ-type ribon-helix-helix transcriptional regulator
MKTISVNVSEPVYRDFMEHARRTDRTAAELIREAMESFRDSRIRPRTSIRALAPLELGAMSAVGADADLLEEMLSVARD